MNPEPSVVPLAGMRVVDLTRNLAGPYCTMNLADLGADVIKIEEPTAGDDTRQWAPPSWNGESTVFMSANRNKRSLAVDLDTPEGIEIVRRLAVRSDILVETFRPGSMAKRGLGYDDLKEANPGLIYCSISAYGQVGPLRESPGYDPVIQANTGIMSLTGYPDGPAARLGISAIDLGTALWATVGVLSAVAVRAGTGRGCRIDSSLYETAAWWVSYQLTGYLATGIVPQRSGTASTFIAPYETFPTADEDLMITAGNDRMFHALIEALGMPELANDPRFEHNPDRVRNRGELRPALERRLRERPAREWEEVLNARSIPCSRVRSIGDLVTDEQFRQLSLLQEVAHPDIPDLRLMGLPVQLDGARGTQRLPPPGLGQHTRDVLKDIGYDEEDIARLRAGGVVSTGEVSDQT